MRTNRVRRKSKMRSKNRRNKVNRKTKKRTRKRTKRTRKRKIRNKRMRGGSSENSNEEVIVNEEEIGYLFKKGQLNTRFQRRFFKVITNSVGEKYITYSESETSKEKGRIPVNSVVYTNISIDPDSENMLLKIKTRYHGEAADAAEAAEAKTAEAAEAVEAARLEEAKKAAEARWKAAEAARLKEIAERLAAMPDGRPEEHWKAQTRSRKVAEAAEAERKAAAEEVAARLKEAVGVAWEAGEAWWRKAAGDGREWHIKGPEGLIVKLKNIILE